MNWLLIVVLCVLALCAAFGYYKGLLRMVYSLVSWIIILLIVSWGAPQIEHYLTENTMIYERVETYCQERIRETANAQVESGLSAGQGELADLGVNVPETVLEGILDQTSGAADALLVQSGVYEQIAAELAGFVMQGLSFVIALITAWIVVHIISQLLGIVSRIPILKGINRTLGLFAGGIYGFLLVWIAFYIIALCSTSETGAVLVSYIYDNVFLTFLYENNLILTLMLGFF